MTYSKKITLIMFLLFLGGFFSSQTALACAVCGSALGQAVRSEIIHTHFLFFTLSILGFFITFYCFAWLTPYLMHYGKGNKNAVGLPHEKNCVGHRLLPVALLFSGGAIAGFLDAILFHQLLQMHALVSNFLPITTLVNVKVNMFWDGMFEFFTLITLLTGFLLIWRGKEKMMNLSGRVFTGWLFLGGGIFNFLDDVINHKMLALHHIFQQAADQGVFYADNLYLIVAILFMVMGTWMIKKSVLSD